MTEDKKPIINIGLLTAPIIIPNFSTSEEGQNIVAEQLLNLYVEILGETWEKLQKMTLEMLGEIGIEVQRMPDEIVKEVILQALSKEEGREGIMSGVLTQKGKVILDEQAAEQLRKGISINN